MNPAPPTTGTLLPLTPGAESRIRNAIDTSNTVEQLIWANRERERKWSQWMGMFQGNPPYNPSDLRNLARRWQNNFNPRTGTGFLSTGCIPYYDLFEGGPTPAVVPLRDAKVAPEVLRERSRIATEEFKFLLETDGWLSDSFYRLCYSFVGFGRGYWFWPNPFGWRPRVKRWHEVLHPEHAETDPTTWEFVVVRVDMSVVELYGLIRDEKAAREAGWNPKAVRDCIKRAVPIEAQSTDDWMLYQKELHDHALTTSSRLGTVQMAYAYAREWDGTWTLGILPRQHSNRGSVPAEYLFFKQGIAEAIDDLLVPFYYDTADGSVNGVEGLGAMIFAAVRNMDRLTCTIADGGHLRALPILAPASASAQVKSGLTVMGGCVTLPAGYNVQSGQVLSDMDGPISAHRHLSDGVQQNTGLYMPKAERPIGNPDTATAAAQRHQQQTKLTVSGVNRFYGYLDRAYNTIYRRVLRTSEDPADTAERKAARDFISSCKERGVTVEMLRKHRGVRAYRVVGAGGATAKQTALGAIFPLVGAMPQKGKQAYIDQLISATVGPAQVREFFPADQDEPGEGEWEAQVENAQANQGAPPFFTPNQAHAAHLRQHVQAMVAGLQAAQQGADPVSVLAFLQVMLPHCAAHLQALGADPTAKEDVAAFGQALTAVVKNMAELENAVKQQQEQVALAQQTQAVQQGVDPKLQLQAAEKQARTQLKARQVEAGVELQARKQAAEMQISAAKHLQEMRQSETKFQAEQRRKAKSAATKEAAD